MLWSKDSVLQTLRAYGTAEQVDAADRSLPHTVDSDRDAELLHGLGLDPTSSSGGGGMGLRPSGDSTAGPAASPNAEADHTS